MTMINAAMETMTYEDLLEMMDSRDLPLAEYESLMESFEEMSEAEPDLEEEAGSDVEYAGCSQMDSEAVYAEVCSLSESLVPLVEEIRSRPRPRRGESQALAEHLHDGDGSARERLISLNLELVLKTALSEAGKYGLDIEDAVSAGMLGLVQAADRYVPGPDHYFSGFASREIRRSIERECCSDASEDGDCSRTKGKSGSSPAAPAVNEPPRMEASASGELSTAEDLGRAAVGAYEESSLITGPEQEALNACIQESLEQLTPKQARILALRFGLEDGREHTLEEISREYHVTRERIRQIEKKALKKISESSCSGKLREFLD